MKNKKYVTGIGLFFSVLLVVGFLNMVLPKPTRSEVEQRELAKKPEFSWSSLADGTYISKYQEYFSDTFLGRDLLVRVSDWIKGFSGLKGENQDIIYSDDTQSKDMGKAEDPNSSQTESASGSSSNSSSKVESDPTVSQNHHIEDESAITTASGIVVAGTTAFQLYNYADGVNSRYAAAINAFAEKYKNINTQCMVVPINTAFYLPEQYLSKVADEKESIEKIYAKMSEQVKTIDAYSELEAHQSEYIYFRTDHHWTQLGAYYGYSAFAKANGIEPLDLSGWNTYLYEEYLGSLYTRTKEERLKANPDYLLAYLPNFSYKLNYFSNNSLTEPESYLGRGTLVTTGVTGISNAYMSFIHGDQPMEVIENLDNPNGKTLMVFKESYGNAFVPFVCNDYETVIVLDPRYFTGSLSELMKLYSVDDALFLNYIYAPGTSQRVDELERIINS